MSEPRDSPEAGSAPVTTRSTAPRRLPGAVLLTTSWESSSEAGWITRQVAGAVASVAEVHIVTPVTPRTPAPPPGRSTDSVFTVHRVSAQWKGAADVLADVAPELAVIAGHSNVDALATLDEALPDVPCTVLALVDNADPAPSPAALLDRAQTVLTVTEQERASVVVDPSQDRKVRRIGAPLAANPSALTEPNTWVGTNDYVLVVTGISSTQSDGEAELARVLRMRFPDTRVGICHTDAFCVWHQGRPHRGWPIERASDMARLMAWARMTVDLSPGPYFGRRCIESLLYGTPIVVPHDSRAREHAERGRGGLWFKNPAELAWCVEAILDPTIRTSLGSQGRSYAEDEYGSTDRFIERVLAGCGLDSPAGVSPVTI